MNTADFKIFVPLLKASRDGDGKMRFHGVASSSIKDRHGDTITRTALTEMERTANENMTIFLNHKYEVPEDVAGSVERAVLRSHPQDPDIQDLVFDIVVNDANERAVKAWEAIDNGTKLGLSIGARIPDGGATRSKDTGRYVIDHIDLLETSIVGVPANPRSWVEYAVKSLNAQEPSMTVTLDGQVLHDGPTADMDYNAVRGAIAAVGGYGDLVTVGEAGPESIEILKAPLSSDARSKLPASAFACPSKRKYPHHTASGAVDRKHLANALARIADPGNDQCGKAHLEAHARALGMGDREKSLEEMLVLAVGDDYDVDHFAVTELTDGADDPDLEAAVAEELAELDVAKAKAPAGHEHPHAHEHDHNHEHWNGIVHSHDHNHTHAHEHTDEHEHIDDRQGSEHDHSHINSYEEDHAHEEDDARKDGDPTLTGDELAAHLAEFEAPPPDTESGDGAAPAPQEAPSESSPENGDAPAEEDAKELNLEPTLKASILANNEVLISITRELVEAKTALVRAEQERDQALALAEKAMTDTSALLKTLAATPMGKRTQVTEAINSFESLKSVYGEAFVDLLKKKETPR